MFDIGFSEILLVMVVALLVLGPERMPGAVRTASLWIGRLRRSFHDIKADIEREVGADDIRMQLHNESVMKALEQGKRDIRQFQSDLNSQLSHDNLAATVTPPEAAPATPDVHTPRPEAPTTGKATP